LAAQAESETQSFETKNLKSVEVSNQSGNVIVSATRGMQATVITNKIKFSEKCKMFVGRENDTLVIKVEKSGLFSDAECQVDFDVKAPKNVDLDLNLGKGKLTVNEIEGLLEFKIGTGHVVAKGSFPRVDGVSGAGDIEIKGLNGGGDIKTGTGNVNLTFAGKAIKGDLDLKSGTGNATLLFPKGTKVKTSFLAGAGDLMNELGDSPGADYRVSMKSGAGNLNVKSY
jgi:hypothetical protein